MDITNKKERRKFLSPIHFQQRLSFLLILFFSLAIYDVILQTSLHSTIILLLYAVLYKLYDMVYTMNMVRIPLSYDIWLETKKYRIYQLVWNYRNGFYIIFTPSILLGIYELFTLKSFIDKIAMLIIALSQITLAYKYHKAILQLK